MPRGQKRTKTPRNIHGIPRSLHGVLNYKTGTYLQAKSMAYFTHGIPWSLHGKFHVYFPMKIPCGVKLGPLFCRIALYRPL